MSGSHETAKELRRSEIPDWLRVDNEGRIWTTHKRFGHKCEERSAERENAGGYLYVYIQGKGLTHSHRVVYAWEHGICPAGFLVRHLNDQKQDNRPSNLALGTTADNARDGQLNGVYNNRGTANPRAKLTESDVIAIRAASANGEPHRSIAQLYGVSDVTVAYVVNRKTWSHVP